MWVFSEFSVSTVPLAKCLNHFWVLQTQIVLDIRTDIFCMKTPSSSVQREQQKKLKLWNFLSIPIDAQPRGGNRQTAKRFCIHWTILLPCCWTFSKRFTVQARLGARPCVEHFFKAFYGSPPAQLGARPPCGPAQAKCQVGPELRLTLRTDYTANQFKIGQ